MRIRTAQNAVLGRAAATCQSQAGLAASQCKHRHRHSGDDAFACYRQDIYRSASHQTAVFNRRRGAAKTCNQIYALPQSGVVVVLHRKVKAAGLRGRCAYKREVGTSLRPIGDMHHFARD